jgi:diaminopimelate epimerase
MAAMARNHHTGLAFMKMHGLGNDFVVLDARVGAVEMTPGLARALADRHRGVGFDQLAVLHPGAGDGGLTFYNADGSGSAACGNATRCIARFLMDEGGGDAVTLQTGRGILTARDAGDGLTAVCMGQPQLEWQEIPLSEPTDTLALPIAGSPVATGMGNPHCTFFVEDAEAVDLQSFGPAHEHHPLFPERTNVQVVHVLGDNHLRMRVWERGTGLTLASGSSSCAVAVAAARRGLTGRSVRLTPDGGDLTVDWREDGVWMTGPTCHVFSGTLTPAFLAGVT